jgi:hypothetical protein
MPRQALDPDTCEAYHVYQHRCRSAVAIRPTRPLRQQGRWTLPALLLRRGSNSYPRESSVPVVRATRATPGARVDKCFRSSAALQSVAGCPPRVAWCCSASLMGIPARVIGRLEVERLGSGRSSRGPVMKAGSGTRPGRPRHNPVGRPPRWSLDAPARCAGPDTGRCRSPREAA